MENAEKNNKLQPRQIEEHPQYLTNEDRNMDDVIFTLCCSYRVQLMICVIKYPNHWTITLLKCSSELLKMYL